MACEGEITYSTVYCDLTIHIDTLTMATDSISYVPPECEEWLNP